MSDALLDPVLASPRVLLATFALMPAGEPGAEALVPALAERGVSADWVCWDDPDVAWGDADLIAVRATWDYHRRLPAFLEWARRAQSTTELLNGAEVFAWNADKAYLHELCCDRSADVPVVPTALADDLDLVPVLKDQIERWGAVVVKPRVGAGGVGMVVAESLDDPRLEALLPAPWVVQPLLASVRTTGETSVYVFDGVAVSQVDKLPATGSDEHRVHEQYGGSSRGVVLDPERADVAERAVRWAAGRTGADLAYGRVDLIVHDGAWVVSEIELIEPGLYLDVVPDNAALFADLVVRRLSRSAG